MLDTDHTPADTPRELGKRGPGAAGDVIDRLAGTEIEQVDRGDTQSPDRAIRGVVTAAQGPIVLASRAKLWRIAQFADQAVHRVLFVTVARAPWRPRVKLPVAPFASGTQPPRFSLSRCSWVSTASICLRAASIASNICLCASAIAW